MTAIDVYRIYKYKHQLKQDNCHSLSSTAWRSRQPSKQSWLPLYDHCFEGVGGGVDGWGGKEAGRGGGRKQAE